MAAVVAVFEVLEEVEVGPPSRDSTTERARARDLRVDERINRRLIEEEQRPLDDVLISTNVVAQGKARAYFVAHTWRGAPTRA